MITMSRYTKKNQSRSEKKKSVLEGGGPATSPLGISTFSPVRSAMESRQARGPQEGRMRTEKFDFQTDLGERFYISGSLVGSDVSTVSPEHVQAVRPICPRRLISSNLIRQRSFVCGQQGKRKRRRSEGGRQIDVVMQTARRGST